jgi:hypothetical protein
MTAENDGTGTTPEGEDPFGYLYRQQGGDGSAAAAPQAGVPRRSYNQVRAVGERQYGGQQQYGGGQQPYQGRQPGGYGQQPSAHYAAPETMPGGRTATRQGPQADRVHGRDGDGGPSRNGLMIGAIAVVAAVVIGIGVAVHFNGGGDESAGSKGQQTSADAGSDSKHGLHKQNGSGKLSPGQLVSKEDAASLRLDGGAANANSVPNAQGKNGTFVGSMNKQGAAATWTINGVPKNGMYTFFVRYGVPGQDANSTLTVNGQAQSAPLNMKNFGGAKQGDWANGWTKTFAWVSLKKGQNNIKVSCEQGNQCNFNLDQVWLKTGKVQH